MIQCLIQPGYVDGGGSATLYWAALYEGAYTEETLPPYVPKGYATELAECQRYYQHIGAETWLMAHYASGYGLIAEFSLASNMRTVPSVIVDAPQVHYYTTGWVDLPTPYAKKTAQGVHVIFNNIGNANIVAGYTYLMKGIHALSADL